MFTGFYIVKLVFLFTYLKKMHALLEKIQCLMSGEWIHLFAVPNMERSEEA